MQRNPSDAEARAENFTLIGDYRFGFTVDNARRLADYSLFTLIVFDKLQFVAASRLQLGLRLIIIKSTN